MGAVRAAHPAAAVEVWAMDEHRVGLHLVTLTPSSPELQPVERLWPLPDEALANRQFADLDALEQAQAARCLTLREQPEVVRAQARFRRWPGAA